MKRLFYYLGDTSIAYRTIMSNHSDFLVNGIKIPKNSVVITEQTHSNHVHVCTSSDSGAGFDNHPQLMNYDAIVTNLPDQYLLIRTADCTPILFYDTQTDSIGAAHSGREGTRKNIAGKVILSMQAAYNTRPENVKVWIGAGICKQHYEVSPAIWDEFAITCRLNSVNIDSSDAPYLDIQDVILQQLIQAGINRDNIRLNTICTYESQLHFSYRRDGSKNRQINIIGLIDG